jgi:hypothetical protein
MTRIARIAIICSGPTSLEQAHEAAGELEESHAGCGSTANSAKRKRFTFWKMANVSGQSDLRQKVP